MISERERRIEAANIVNRVLYHCGELSALVPRGPLRDRVDDETEHMAELAEAIGTWKPAEPPAPPPPDVVEEAVVPLEGGKRRGTS